MKKKSTQSRGGVKGGFPLAGSRGGAPCGVWGNAPTVPRATSMPNTLNKGAGSEASLPVTKKPSNTVQSAWEATAEGVQRAIGKPSGSMAITSWLEKTTMIAYLLLAGDFASAEATKGLSDRPLETFGLHTPILDFYWKTL